MADMPPGTEKQAGEAQGVQPAAMGMMQLGKSIWGALPSRESVNSWFSGPKAPATSGTIRVPRPPLAAVPMAKAAGVIDELKGAKRESDRKNYPAKHRALKKLFDARPHEFHVDSEQGAFAGITHTNSGFRLHLPRKLVPAHIERRLPARKAAGMSPLLLGMTTPRKAAPKRRRPARKAPTPAAPPEPSPEEALAGVAEGLRARRVRRQLKAAEEWAAVPAVVAARVKAGALAPWPEGSPLASPVALADRLVAASLALPERVSLSMDRLPTRYNDRLQKRADAGFYSGGLFTPSIPVDAFNSAVWTDAWQNPFGSRSTFGDNGQVLRTPPQVAAAVSGVVSGAGAGRNSTHVSPWDVAVAAGTAAGKGWLGGLVLGKTVGALAGMPPEAQKKLQDIGLWGGLLSGAARAVFGGGG